MDIETLTQKILDSAKMRTPEQRRGLLQKTGILDEDGNFDRRYFYTECTDEE